MEGTMVVAMIGEYKVGTGTDGMFQIDLDGEMDSMVMFTLMKGEGDAMMEYMASSDQDVMGDVKGQVMLSSYNSEENIPPSAVTTKTAEEQTEAVRRAIQEPPGIRAWTAHPDPRATTAAERLPSSR